VTCVTLLFGPFSPMHPPLYFGAPLFAPS
jgi:hypothetical protein